MHQQPRTIDPPGKSKSSSRSAHVSSVSGRTSNMAAVSHRGANRNSAHLAPVGKSASWIGLKIEPFLVEVLIVVMSLNSARLPEPSRGSHLRQGAACRSSLAGSPDGDGPHLQEGCRPGSTTSATA